jgi:hypothetical protein
MQNPWTVAGVGATLTRYLSLRVALLVVFLVIMGLGAARMGGTLYFRYQSELQRELELTEAAQKKMAQCTEQYGSPLSFDPRVQEVCFDAVQQTRIDSRERAFNTTWNSLPTLGDVGSVVLNTAETRLYALCIMGVLTLLGHYLIQRLTRTVASKQAKKRVGWLHQQLEGEGFSNGKMTH